MPGQISVGSFESNEAPSEYGQLTRRESTRGASIARVRYREGAIDFLGRLDAERTELQAEDAVALAEADVFVGVVSLYKPLGGIPASTP